MSIKINKPKNTQIENPSFQEVDPDLIQLIQELAGHIKPQG